MNIINPNAGTTSRATLVLSTTDNVQFKYLGLNVAPVSTQGLTIVTALDTDKGIVVKGAASQSGNLQEWQNNSSTVLASIDKDGHIYMSHFAHDQVLINVPTNGGASLIGTLLKWSVGGADRFNIYSSNNFNGEVSISASEALTLNGNVRQGGGVIGGNTCIIVASQGVSAIPLAIKAVSSQSANLQEWRNNSDSILSAIAKNGAFKPASLADSAAENNTVYYSTDASALVYKDGAGVVNALY